MTLRELPLLNGRKNDGKTDNGVAVGLERREGPVNRPAVGSGGAPRGHGRYGAAHARARDAYRDVPILQKPTWGPEVAAYFYLGGVSSGAYMLGALADLCGGPRRRRLARTAHYVAFAAMVPCAPLLIADLGKRSRFHHMLRIFKPSSPMNLGAWALTTHGAMSTVTVARVLAAEGKLPVLGPLVALLPEHVLVPAGMPSALTLGGYTGVLLGTSSVPVWYKSPLLGALFTSSALSTGAAATALASLATGRDDPDERRALAPLHLTLGAAEAALLAGYTVTSGSAATALRRGKVGALVGGAAALTLVALGAEAASTRKSGSSRLLSAVASGATLLSGALLRWGVVRAGHVSASDREGTLEAMKPSDRAPGWGNDGVAS